jgi:DNA-binding protein H-NS
LAQVQEQIVIAERSAIKAIQNQITDLANEAGVSLEQVLQWERPRYGPKPGGKIPMRYQHPENPQLQWTGRGMQPRWVRAWIAENGAIDGLLISTNGVEKDAS